MKLFGSTIPQHTTRLIGYAGVALAVVLSISAAARFTAASPISRSMFKSIPMLASVESNNVSNAGELLQDIAKPAATAKTRQVMMEVTAYCPCTKCCGPKAQGITASGKRVSYNAGRFVAADRSMKFGTKLVIPGYHNAQPVEVLDRGGAIKGNKLDVFFATHKEALKWGRQHVMVTVVD
jgi:3D (Asp-Asp-Asp) domain-containing protein